jgi:hypothetical protein
MTNHLGSMVSHLSQKATHLQHTQKKTSVAYEIIDHAEQQKDIEPSVKRMAMDSQGQLYFLQGMLYYRVYRAIHRYGLLKSIFLGTRVHMKYYPREDGSLDRMQ